MVCFRFLNPDTMTDLISNQPLWLLLPSVLMTSLHTFPGVIGEEVQTLENRRYLTRDRDRQQQGYTFPQILPPQRFLRKLGLEDKGWSIGRHKSKDSCFINPKWALGLYSQPSHQYCNHIRALGLLNKLNSLRVFAQSKIFHLASAVWISFSRMWFFLRCSWYSS